MIDWKTLDSSSVWKRDLINGDKGIPVWIDQDIQGGFKLSSVTGGSGYILGSGKPASQKSTASNKFMVLLTARMPASTKTASDIVFEKHGILWHFDLVPRSGGQYEQMKATPPGGA